MPAAAAAIAHEWNTILLDYIRDQKSEPPIASRAMSIANSAVFEAVNAIDGSYASNIRFPLASANASMPAAAAAAAFDTPVTLFPARKTILETRYAQSIASTPDDSRRTAGIEVRQRAAARILEIRANDGSASTASYTPGTDPGDWQNTPPALLNPLLPQGGQVTPLVLSSNSQFQPEAPKKIDSSNYARNLNEVQQLNAVNNTTRTMEYDRQYHRSGTATVTVTGRSYVRNPRYVARRCRHPVLKHQVPLRTLAPGDRHSKG